MRDELPELIEGVKPGLLLRKKSDVQILQRIMYFVEAFINGMMGEILLN